MYEKRNKLGFLIMKLLSPEGKKEAFSIHSIVSIETIVSAKQILEPFMVDNILHPKQDIFISYFSSSKI